MGLGLALCCTGAAWRESEQPPSERLLFGCVLSAWRSWAHKLASESQLPPWSLVVTNKRPSVPSAQHCSSWAEAPGPWPVLLLPCKPTGPGGHVTLMLAALNALFYPCVAGQVQTHIPGCWPVSCGSWALLAPSSPGALVLWLPGVYPVRECGGRGLSAGCSLSGGAAGARSCGM